MNHDTDFANPYEKEIAALNDRIQELEVELDKREATDFNSLIENFKLEYSKEGVETRMAFNQNILALVTYPFCNMLKDADNYVEMTLVHKDKLPYQEILLTLQKKSGKTPHNLRRDAEAKAKNLETCLRAWVEWEDAQIRKEGPYAGEAINKLIADAKEVLNVAI